MTNGANTTIPVLPLADRYAVAHTTPSDEVVEAARAGTEARTAESQMAGGRVEVKLLEAFAVATRATRVLEIGTFTGVTALSLAAKLPRGGKLVTLEVNETHAAIARRHFEGSPFADRIELIVGDALQSLAAIDGPFDLIFVDAWKPDYPAYYEAVLPKLADHGVLVADNVLQHGRVLDPPDGDERAAAMVAFAEMVQNDERVDNAFLTVGDGLLLAWKRADRSGGPQPV